MNAPGEALEDSFDELLPLLRGAERALVVGHVGPDGDAVGSTLAMTLLLGELGVDATPYNRDPIPYNFRFLPGGERWVNELPDDDFDLVVVLDCAEPGRVGDVPERIWKATTVVLDHHQTWDADFADCYVRDVDAAATGELVFEVARRADVMTREIAENLYTCVMCDTGSFRYSNTSKRTFHIAGELVEAGVDPWHITSHVYESQPLERLQILSEVLSTLELSDDGKLAFLRLDRSTFDEMPDPALIDGFINYARSVRGVEVATQLMEIAPDTFKISFRSRGVVDVSALASRFGGGGHHNAAGCTIRGEAVRVQQDLANALHEMLG